MSECVRRRFDPVRVRSRACWIIAVLPALMPLVLVGCGKGSSGKPTAHLSGTITIDGQPVSDNVVGSVTFRPPGTGQASPATAQVIDGKYDCPNAPQGNVTVFFQLIQQTGKMAGDPGRQYPETRNLLAEKYSVSGIDLTVTDDNSNQDFALTSK
jgi:hypothetical protein